MGVATASFQSEGNPAPSDWNEWHRVPGHTEDGSTADRGNDFWNLYEKDFGLTKELGANAFRMSIAWERIEPENDVWGEAALTHYESMIVSAHAHGLEPIVTLHHFPFPLWIKKDGGVLSEKFPANFADYAYKVVERLSRPPANVVYWMTFNEPVHIASAGYWFGWWPPEFWGGYWGMLQAQSQFAAAHLDATEKIRGLGRKAHVGFAQAWPAFEPLTDSPADREATLKANWLYHEYLVDAMMTGRLYDGRVIPLPHNRPGLDYLGVNYYTRAKVFAKADAPYFQTTYGNCPRSDLNWEICPEYLVPVLKEASRFVIPILISENGIGDVDDTERPAFLRAHIQAALRAKAEGVNLIGYLHWSLTDNWEWQCGLKCRFGLVEINYETMERKPRPSFYVYRDLISTAKKSMTR